MGKYSHLKSKLDPFQHPPDFQSKVNDVKVSFAACNASDMARAFAMVRNEKKQHEAEISRCNVELEALSQMLVENLEAENLQKIQLGSGETVYLQPEPYSSIENKETLLAYIKKNKMTAMLTVAWQTLNSINKERLVSGKPSIPGTKVFLKTSARLRGANSTNGDE